MDRRNFVSTTLLGSTGLASAASVPITDGSIPGEKKDWQGIINHSVCRWCFDQIPTGEFFAALRDMGIQAVDLVEPVDFPLLKTYGLSCSMVTGAHISLTDGFNDPRFHDELVRRYSELIPVMAGEGFTNLICFSGNRRGMDDYTGMEHCARGLERILPLAEKHGVVLQMELFNQRNHPDYMADHTLWGVSLCRRLGSENFRLLYDIYHMQIQEGDIIQTIRENSEYLGHYHTAGVPGRHEIGEDQELNYPAIMRAIAETGFQGYVAQEFIPTWDDPLKSLRKAFELCDISRY